MEENDFYIENVVESGRRKTVLPNIEVGDNVKIILRLTTPIDNIDAERLWFKVESVNDDGTLLVSLDNDPVYIRSISGTDTITVKNENILDVLE